MMEIINQFKTLYRLHSSVNLGFGSKIQFEFEIGSYLVKIAKTSKDLLACFSLRNQVFNIEFRDLKGFNYDFDEFDSICDHIMIIHKPTKEVVGTYRLNLSTHFETFYTNQEFSLGNFPNASANMLELGRACIEKNHRRGIVISLLWKGIAEYMNLSKAETLFGCSSVKVTEARESALIYTYLSNKDHLDLSYGAKPRASYSVPQLNIWLEYFEKNYNESLHEEAEALIPSLLKSYLKMGAKIIAEPALDEDFNCIDFLTLLNREDLTQVAEKKYGVKPLAT